MMRCLFFLGFVLFFTVGKGRILAYAESNVVPASFGYGCGVVLPVPVRKVSYIGGCINGLAEGWGEMEVFQDPYGRLQHQGYFHQGYALDQWHREGDFFHDPQGTLYFHAAQDFGDLFFPANPSSDVSWGLCSRPASLSPNPMVPDAKKRARAYYQTLCTQGPGIFVSFKNPYRTSFRASMPSGTQSLSAEK
jgi:hypothetical protein